MPIFDQGYQHWKGPLTGHAWRWLAITRHGVRVQVRSRLVRGLLLLAWLPALALVVAVAVWGLVEQKSAGVLNLVSKLLPPEMLLDPYAYRSAAWTVAYSFFFRVQIYCIMLLVVFAGPGLISRDLRFNALPLYLSRPMTRFDYFLGKLGVIAALVAAVAVGPAVVAYVVGVIFSLDVSVVKYTYHVLLASMAYGLVITVSVGTLILAMSSLSRRSLYIGIAWFGLWTISATVGASLTEINRESLRWEIHERELAIWMQQNPPPAGTQMHQHGPALNWDPATRRATLAGLAPGHQEEGERWFREWQQASGAAWDKARNSGGEGATHDWRPLCSYVSNLDRIGEGLLNTDAAWLQVGRAAALAEQKARQLAAAPTLFGFGKKSRQPQTPPINERFLADQLVPQYPWWWSGAILAGLMGISAWTLSRRVKSLDRLK